jgi:beta-glucanase (GH16 family)
VWIAVCVVLAAVLATMSVLVLVLRSRHITVYGSPPVGAQADRTPEPGAPPAPPVTTTPTTTTPPTSVARSSAATTAPPVPPVTVEAPAPIRGAGYRLVFSDDFSGSAPDPGVWATAPFGDSLPATAGGGLMTLQTTASHSYYWAHIASTGPRSTSEPNYPGAKAWQEGYFEARIRYSDNPWSWPAFWLLSMSKTEAWPDENCSELDSEWDIMENGVENAPGDRPAGGNWYGTALHRNTTDNTSDGYCGTPDEVRGYRHDFTDTKLSDWHTWGARWGPGIFCTYMDGMKIQCTQPWDTTAQPMHLVFTMQYLGTCSGCPARPHELEMQVDWVRVWQTR